ncbi:MAG: DUF2240 family protein [Nitrosotalea sp.]
MAISKLINEALKDKGIPTQTIHSRKRAIRNKVKNAISSEVALDIVASKEGVDVHRLLKKEGRLQELEDYKQAIGSFDFDNQTPTKLKSKQKTISKEPLPRSPYDLPLSQYHIDPELIQDCKLIKPFRNPIKEALLTLETRIQKLLGLDSTFYGTKLIAEVKKREIFARKDQGEADGLFFLYMGAIQWLRNPAGHKKIQYTKEDAMKIVLFTDHLIKLFDDLFNKRI